MDDYTREMMDLKTLVTRTLEKKGVLAKIRVPLSLSLSLHFPSIMSSFCNEAEWVDKSGVDETLSVFVFTWNIISFV